MFKPDSSGCTRYALWIPNSPVTNQTVFTGVMSHDGFSGQMVNQSLKQYYQSIILLISEP